MAEGCFISPRPCRVFLIQEKVFPALSLLQGSVFCLPYGFSCLFYSHKCTESSIFDYFDSKKIVCLCIISCYKSIVQLLFWLSVNVWVKREESLSTLVLFSQHSNCTAYWEENTTNPYSFCPPRQHLKRASDKCKLFYSCVHARFCHHIKAWSFQLSSNATLITLFKDFISSVSEPQSQLFHSD